MIRIVCVPNIFIVRTNGALSAEAREYHHRLREKEKGRERSRASTHQKKNRDDSGWTVYLDVPHGNNWFNKGIIFNYDFFPSLSLSLCLYLFRPLHLPESHINFKGVSQFLYTHFSVPLTFLFLLRLPNCLTAVRYYTRSSLLCYCCYYYICVYTFFFSLSAFPMLTHNYPVCGFLSCWYRNVFTWCCVFKRRLLVSLDYLSTCSVPTYLSWVL